MAGDWTAIEHATPRKTEIMRLAHETGRSRHEVLGLMVEFWAWVETQTGDGNIAIPVSCLPSVIGADVAFWSAVVSVGWIELPADTTAETAPSFSIPRANHWIEKGAKSRLAKNRRQAQWRRGCRRADDSIAPPKAPTTEQKRREQKREVNTPLPPTTEFDDHQERDEPDWLIVESEFIARWNALEGVATHNGNAFEGTRLCTPFRESWRDPGWRERATKAMGKFPLQNGAKISLRKFLEPTTIDEILGGCHDFTRDRSRRNGRDPTRVHDSGTDADFEALAGRVTGEPA